MKRIKDADLIIGEQYWDLDEIDELGTLLELVKKDSEGLYFKYISGKESYIKNEEGLMYFCFDDQGWYQED